MISCLVDGFRAVRRSWGLVLLLLSVNVSSAALLAVPLAGVLERDMRNTEAARCMLYGFDHGWWSQWADGQSGWTASFRPDILGVGFALKNVSLLLNGELPARLLATPKPDLPEQSGALDPVILGLGLVYLLLQAFLTGGILGVLRAPQGSWTVRGLLHGSGFYFGRLVRVTLLALLLLYILFLANAPLAHWIDEQAREAVSETTAVALVLGRHTLLLGAILLVSMVVGYAKVIVVLEERSSAVLAMVSSLAFCLRHLLRTTSHYFAMTMLAVALVVSWHALDGLWETTGYRTQIVSLLLAQGLMFGRIGLRLALLGGQISVYRRASSITV